MFEFHQLSRSPLLPPAPLDVTAGICLGDEISPPVTNVWCHCLDLRTVVTAIFRRVHIAAPYCPSMLHNGFECC
ncbi:hypothetical protein R1flu_016024 [Riccia fluitans]|uniref:Uncharacterized protein n=1 Tax=Riccia fluitans TaxID=41844 RepID=A0ABD1YKM3_9MARC